MALFRGRGQDLFHGMGKLAWCVPPLLGLASFAGVRALSPAAQVLPVSRPAAGLALLHAGPSDVLSAIERAKSEQEAAAAAKAETFPSDNEALKAEYLKLKQKLLS